MKGSSDKELSALFVLLRAGLWEKEPDTLSSFPLSDKCWEKVFLMARQQTVTGIVYQGLCRLPEHLLPPEPILLRWVAETDTIERNNRRMNRTLAELYRLFGDNGIMPVLQKGQGIALLYEKPLSRECGDIDLYFPTKQEGDKAIALIKELGKRVKNGADKSYCYTWKGIEVEHHARLLDIANPFVQKHLKEIELSHGYETISMKPSEDLNMRVPSPVLNLLLLNSHIMKHSLGWGVGLRQLCDMARAYHSWHGEIDGEELKKLYRKAGILRWSNLLHNFLVEHIGLDASCLPYPEKSACAKPLLEIVLQGGNFGLHLSGRSHNSQSFWERKAKTSCSFLRNLRFSLVYAPNEAFWTFFSLIIGLLSPKSSIFTPPYKRIKMGGVFL